MKGEARSSDGIPLRFEARGSGRRRWCSSTVVRPSYWDGQLDRVLGPSPGRGHGPGRPRESGAGRQAWTMAAFGDDVVAVVQALGLGEVVLIGHSMGGDIVVEAALRLPDQVVGLVWADVYTRLDEPQPREEVERFLTPLREDFGTAAQQLVRRMFPPAPTPSWSTGWPTASRRPRPRSRSRSPTMPSATTATSGPGCGS